MLSRMGQCLLAAMVLTGLAVSMPAGWAADDGEGPEVPELTVTRHEDYYRAKNREYKLYVSTRLVDMKTDEKPGEYIALIFGVWNRRAKAFYVDRDRIRLLDRYGAELPMAELEELRKGYPNLRRDQQHRDFTTFGGRFPKGDSRLVPTNFFPPPGRALAATAQVHRHRRVKDLLYFRGAMAPGETCTLEVPLRGSDVVLRIPFESRGAAGDGRRESNLSGSITISP